MLFAHTYKRQLNLLFQKVICRLLNTIKQIYLHSSKGISNFFVKTRHYYYVQQY